MRLVFLTFLILSLVSCQQFAKYNYPGDEFSRTLGSVDCRKSGEDVFIYSFPEGEIELDLSSQDSFLKDRRNSQEKTLKLSSLHYDEKVDSSLRFFIRESMKVKHLKRLFGNGYDKWGGVTSAMMIWPMMDGRYLAILPSTLEMPHGMNSYTILNKYRTMDRSVSILPLKE
ncbi:MAG: hypothetical protein NE334_07870 [Lentisphaeraceae bacterium]|nr:hypothetical protein [Lentisphaeraceae bacterium]